MKNEQQDILRETILTELQSVKSVDDFCGLLNRILSIKYPDYEKQISPKQLHFFAHNPNEVYTTFYIKKKSGKLREITAPAKQLKLVQELINEILIACYPSNNSACGFVRGKSIVDGAKQHVNQHYVFNIDLKDFFDSFEWYQVRNLFTRQLFNFVADDQKEDLAGVIAHLCCAPKMVERIIKGEPQSVSRFVTPQGAPTSPMLTNLFCVHLDKRLGGLAKKYGAVYTRYADDISFSHSHNIFKEDSNFRKQIKEIIEATPHLRINEAKTRLQGRRYRQEVTGIIVNEQVNVPRRYINQIRKWLYLWETYGYAKADSYFTEFYIKDKGHVLDHLPGLERVLDGKLNYIKMIKGADNATYLKLYQRFRALARKDIQDIIDKNTNTDLPIYNILQSIVDAM